MTALLLCSWLSAAVAGQVSHEIDRGPSSWSFRYAWEDVGGQRHKVAFELPASAVVDDREETTGLARKELYEHAAQEVRAWARKRKDDVKVEVRVDQGRIELQATGPRGDVKDALKEAQRVQDEAMDRWLAEHDYTRVRSGEITFDHAALVGVYADDLRPVATALAADAPDPRAFAELALSFVQSIPYEARKKSGGDPGYRRPLALLSRNRGDCDSKAVLYLALVRAAHPDLDLAVIYVPEHALAGVALPEEKGDRAFDVDGTTFLYVEPVGPALHPLGETDPANKKAGKKGEVHVVPRG